MRLILNTIVLSLALLTFSADSHADLWIVDDGQQPTFYAATIGYENWEDSFMSCWDLADENWESLQSQCDALAANRCGYGATGSLGDVDEVAWDWCEIGCYYRC